MHYIFNNVNKDDISNNNSKFLFRPSKEAEERAQMAIENFFANNLIAPSPWSNQTKATKKVITTSDSGTI